MSLVIKLLLTAALSNVSAVAIVRKAISALTAPDFPSSAMNPLTAQLTAFAAEAAARR